MRRWLDPRSTKAEDDAWLFQSARRSMPSSTERLLVTTTASKSVHEPSGSCTEISAKSNWRLEGHHIVGNILKGKLVNTGNGESKVDNTYALVVSGRNADSTSRYRCRLRRVLNQSMVNIGELATCKRSM